MANGEHIEVAKAYVTIVPSMEGSQKTIATEMGAVTEPAAKEAGEKSGKNFGESLAKGIKTTSAVIAGALTAATGAAVATGKAFLDTANDVSAMGDAIGDNAAKMGVSTKFYQEYDFLLQRAGSSIDSLKTSMKTLANAAVNGSDAFAQLGISQEEVATLNQEQLFERTITALQGVDDTVTRTALASKLLGKGATELGGIFDMTADEVAATKQEMYDLGAYMDEDMISASDDYQDTMLNMKDSIKGLKISMMKDFLPGVTSVMDGLSKVFSGQGGVEEIQTGLKSVITNITAMAPQFFSLAQTLIISLLEGFGPMLPQLATTIFSVINQALVTVVTMLPQLLPAITSGISSIMQSLFECLPIITSSLFMLIGDLVTWLSDSENIETFVNGIVDLTAQIASQMSEILPVLLPAIIKIIGSVANTLVSPQNIGTLVKAVLQIASSIFVALVNTVPELINFVVGVFQNIWGYITQFGGTFLKSAASWIASVLVKIGTFVKDIIGKVKGLPSELTNIGKNLVSGLWNGINDKLSWVTNKIKGMGSSITKAIKSVFGIHSPSKVWKDQIGSMLALGIGEGFTDTMGDVKADMVDSMDGLTGNMTANVISNTGSLTPGNTTTYNGGNITLNVYGAEGQNVDELVNKVAYKLEELTRRQEMLWS